MYKDEICVIISLCFREMYAVVRHIAKRMAQAAT